MRMKKFLAFISALCMVCAVVPVLPVQETAVISASAEEEYTEGTYENLKYTNYADYVEISGATDRKLTEAVIPAEIDGLPVTSIGWWAFSNCTSLTSVTIPDSVT
ncbi:MAG: fibronectin type III domain-containing protein, partial [Oscillospiraceae bacterium]|nr:fibronectin type III domain-containing protein [Oscillospiraceae bacterium]